MFCSRCGEQVDTSSRFCPRCGQDLTALTGAGKPGATAPIAAQPPQENETDIVREALKDEYELEKELGRGGMAVVFKARDKQLDREVAIKVLPFSLSFDAEFVERFQREARTAGKLEHPNIIPIYRVGKSGRVIFFVMKFIRGKSLSGVIENRGALPVAEIKRLLTESASALGYAHKHGIVHRDIKPDNIMFDELGQAIVADFGIAKAQSGAKLTGTGMSIGTPHYMSPEQARAQNLDGRSDLYSLGVVAYQCLTGHVPFDGEDSFSIGYKHIMEELPIPSLENQDQREMFGIVQKMMAKKPDDRYQTADELIRAMEGAATHAMDISNMTTRAIEPMKAPPRPTAPPPAAVSAATAPLPRASASMGKPKEAKEPPKEPPSPPERPSFKPKEVTPKKSNAVPIGIAAVLVLALGGLGGYLYLSKHNAQQQPPTTLAANSPAALPPASSDSTHGAPADTARPAAHDTAKAPVATPAPHTPSGTSRTPPATSRTPPVAATARTPTTPGTTPPGAAAAGEGTISLSNLPRGASVSLDQRPRTGEHFKVAPGQHTLEVTLQGFTPFRATVTVERGRVQMVPVAMTRATGTPGVAAALPGATPLNPACASPTGNINQRNHCWDTRPSARASLTLQPPPSCRGSVSPANVLVNVAASGDVVTASKHRDSSCPDFTLAAVAQVENMMFTPAMRNGAPVAAWVVVTMQPVRP